MPRDDDPLTAAAGTDPVPLIDQAVLAAMEAGAPWWLALEAAATVRMDRDPDDGTHEVR